MVPRLKTRLKKSWVILALLLACSAAYAGVFTPTEHDQSLKHLYNLFGAVGNQLGPEVVGKQLLGSLIRWLNLGLLGFVCLIVTYTVIMGVVKTAQEGALMGRDGKSGMAAIRTVLGIALLVPGSTGYSLIQVFIMWVVIQGVGLADNIWVTGVQYLNSYASQAFDTSSAINEDSISVSGESELMLRQISPAQSMVPVAMSSAVSQMCSRYINALFSQHAVSSKKCADDTIMQSALSQAKPADSELSMCRSIGVNAMYEANSAEYEAYQTALDQEESSPTVGGVKDRLINRLINKFIASESFSNLKTKLLAGNAFPQVKLHLATRDAGANATFSAWQEGAKGTLFAVYGIKEDAFSRQDDPAKVKAVCGAYTLGPVSSLRVDAARYLGFNSLQQAMVPLTNDLFDSTFYKKNVLLTNYKTIFKPWKGLLEGETNQKKWVTAVKFGIEGWRTNIEPVIKSGEADIAQGPGDVDISEGWIYAGGYYYKFSRSSSQGMGKLRALANNLALCHFVNGDFSTGNLTNNALSAGLLYPFGCLESKISTPKVTCRRDWNQVGDGKVNHCQLNLSSNEEDEEYDPTKLEENEENSLWQLSLDLLSQEDDDQNLAEILSGGAAQAIRRSIKYDILKAKHDYIHMTMHQMTTYLYYMNVYIKKKIIKAEEDYNADLKVKYDKNKKLALKQVTKMNTAKNTGDNRRDKNRKSAQVSFFTNLALTAAVSIGVAALAGMGGGSVLLAVTWAVIIAAAAAWSGLMSGGDPIHKMIIMGQVMGAMGLVAWFIIGIFLTISMTVAGTMNSIHGMSEGIKVAINWLAPMFQMVLMVSLANAGMLAIYVPMIPLMIYLFAVLGWMITVLEAIIAGPLIAMGITHPQGQDMLGKSEQAMMMLISVFLRPALITIGFFASILFVRIAFDIFLGMISDYMVTAMGIHGINLIIAVAFLTIYTVVVIGVIEVAFSLINVIPERVMHWIGVQGMAQELGRQTMQMAQSASKEVGSDVAKAGTAGLTGAGNWQGSDDSESSSAQEK